MMAGRGVWRLSARGAVPALVTVALATGACERQPPATVRIVEPADEAVVTGPQVRVVLEAMGIEIAPAADERRGTAHHHLYLDVDLGPPTDTIPAGVTGILHLGRGQTEFTFDSLPPGPHRLIAVLADAWHVPLQPPAVDTVTFTLAP